MHNMITEDERDLNAPIQNVLKGSIHIVEMTIDKIIVIKKFKDKEVHFELHNALIGHL